MRHPKKSVIATAFFLGALALGGRSSPQSIDLCGCSGNPASLGAFDTKNESTWASIGGVLQGFVLTLPVPEDGVFIFDSFVVSDLPSGGNLRLEFQPNEANTPVTLLVAGDVFIGAGDILDVAGEPGQNAADNSPGVGGFGGPGGHKGGDGGFRAGSPSGLGGAGLGPNGGAPGLDRTGNTTSCPQGGDCEFASSGFRGTFRGASDLLPVTGGSGGGGGSTASSTTLGASGGGGGGGGALLIAANGAIRIHGTIDARGGQGGREASGQCNPSGDLCSGAGGPGSGGGVRLVGSSVTGTGSVFATGGLDGANNTNLRRGSGGNGRIRFEAFSIDLPTSSANVNPTAFRVLSPGAIEFPIFPTVAVTAVGGAGVVQPPGGWRGSRGPVDVVIAASGPVAVEVMTSGVPGGTEVDVTVKPAVGGPGVTTTALLEPGNCDPDGNCFGNASVSLNPGRYVIEAEATFRMP